MKNIISASRRTDIPAFHYGWLQEALSKGSAELSNPVFQNKTYTVDLRAESVHSIVLWSKNLANVVREPGILEDYNLYFQYTVNNYSRALEPNVPEYRETLAILEGLLKKYRPEQFNIRFDPVIISTNGEVDPTPDKPGKARLKAFEGLCRDLRSLGMEKCRVSTSYITMYGHVTKKLGEALPDMLHLNLDQQLLFFGRMAETAQKHGISLYSCASHLLEQVEGIKKGHCIDGALLISLFGGKVSKSKDKGQRQVCGCTRSRDIGAYARGLNGMKCLHGCKYCYVMPEPPVR